MTQEAIVCKLYDEKEADKSTWEYVTIPDVDIFDNRFPTIRVNHEEFLAGKRYFCCPSLAKEVREILERRQREDIRILRPDKNRKALNEAVQHGEHARRAELT